MSRKKCYFHSKFLYGLEFISYKLKLFFYYAMSKDFSVKYVTIIIFLTPTDGHRHHFNFKRTYEQFKEEFDAMNE